MHHHHVGGVAQGGGQGGGQPDGEHRPGKAHGDVPRVEGDRRPDPQAPVRQGEKDHRGGVGKRRGDGGARHIQVKDEDEDGIEHDIEDTAEHHAGAGWAGVPLAAQQVAQDQTDRGGYAAQYHHPEQVAFGIGIGGGAGAQEVEQRPVGQKGEEGETQRHRRAAPDAEGGHMPDVLPLPGAQHAGDQAAAAQAEQVAQGGEQVKPRRHQRDGRHHGRIAGLADEKGVGQVIDHGHHLADNGGDGQRRHRPGHGHLFK